MSNKNPISQSIKGRGTLIVLMSVFVMVFLLFPAACTSIDCPVNNTVHSFYKLEKPNGTPDTLGVDTMWVRSSRSNGTDTLLINSLCGTSATQFKIPMSYTQPEDLVYLTVKDTSGIVWKDTIRVKKENHPRFESVDCQARYFHTITSVMSTKHLIDTVIINNRDVNYDTSKMHFLLRLKARR